MTSPRHLSLDTAAVRRWAHWPHKTTSPYFPQFYGALQPHGVVPVATMGNSVGWLATGQADVLHFHWPDSFWRRDFGRYLGRVKGIWNVRAYLKAAKRAGLKIVWTVHNHDAHEGGDWLDVMGYRILADEADLIICHTRWSADAVVRSYRPTGDIVMMSHGNMDGVYPVARPRSIVAAELGLDPGRPIVSCLGYLRRYKGLELACQAVQHLHGEVQWLIAGPPRKGYNLRPLREAAAALPNVVLIDRWTTNQEFADFAAASDAVLLPYTQVTTSGALLAAWTLGSGVICSDLPFFRELVPEPSGAGRLFSANSSASLAEAIRSHVAIPREERIAAAIGQAQKYSWSTCVRPVVDWIEKQRGNGLSGMP